MLFFSLLIGLLGCAAAPRAMLRTLDMAQLRVEAGRVDQGAGHTLELRSAGIRAVAREHAHAAVEMTFVYRGQGRSGEPLASGELRRQIGLKLRALDTCNVVYVMWHVEPSHGIHVSVKSNPSGHDHQSCHDHGYLFLQPTSAPDVVPIAIGERHTLAAPIDPG